MKTTTAQTTTTAQIPYPEIDASTAPSFDIDISDFLNPGFNTIREKSFPTATLINGTDIVAQGVGFFVNKKNLISAGWKVIDESKFVEADFPGNPEKDYGYIFTKVNMAIIASTPVYLRFKTDPDKAGDMAGTLIGWIDSFPDFYQANKDKVDACCDRLIILLDESNQPLHKTPIKVRFRNVALWSSLPILAQFYESAEAAFTEYALEKGFPTPNAAKDDKWRAAIAFKCTFFPEKVGTGSNKSQCCKIKEWVMPTKDNIKDWLLFQPELKALIWKEYDLNAVSFAAPKALPPLPSSTPLALPPGLRSAEVDF